MQPFRLLKCIWIEENAADLNVLNPPVPELGDELLSFEEEQSDSVPNELRKIMNNLIFLIDELTLDVMQSRTYKTLDSGD